MDTDNRLAVPSERTELGRKSWVAYVRVCVGNLLFLIVAAIAWHFSTALGAAAVLLVLANLAYRMIELRSYLLYYDTDGVWVYGGVLPWNKGAAGVKWRDLDEAVFLNNMTSWATRSYSVRIGHRFTKSSEIFQSDILSGQKAVETINALHLDMVRDGRVSR